MKIDDSSGEMVEPAFGMIAEPYVKKIECADSRLSSEKIIVRNIPCRDFSGTKRTKRLQIVF